MNFNLKYLKYKHKYFILKELCGGNMHELIDTHARELATIGTSVSISSNETGFHIILRIGSSYLMPFDCFLS